MKTSSQIRFDDRQKLINCLWSELDMKSFRELTLDDLAQMARLTSGQAIIAGGSIEALLLSACAQIDEQALAESAADFEDDMKASFYEKLLEGLIHRFEIYAPYRRQMQVIHEAGQHNPRLGLRLAGQLATSIKRLLWICGDTDIGGKQLCRVAGICGVVLRIRPIWQKDETSDLSPTIKALDKELKNAAQWAMSFYILKSDQDDHVSR